MTVQLTPRYLIVASEGKGPVIRKFILFDRISSISFSPDDVFQAYPGWGFKSAAEHVDRMARDSKLEPEDLDTVARFRKAVTPSHTTGKRSWQ